MRTMGLLAASLLAASASAEDFAPKAELPAPPADVWVTVDKADLAAPGFPLSGDPVAESGGAAVYRAKPDMLPVLAQWTHERFNRCGGFFTHETKASALSALRPTAAAPGGPYTLDQQAVVTPMIAAVREEKIRATIVALSAYQNRYYQSDTGVEAARWIRDRWAALASGIPGASAALETHSWKQPSVILTIPGTDKPDEIVVLGGHLDSIAGWGSGSTARAPGADDNASGIATITEALRVLAESGVRPRRTIQFIGYAAEEVGLRGSQDIAGKYASAGKKVVGVIQFDMSNFAGSGKKIYLLTDHVDPVLSAFVAKLVDAYAGVPRAETRCGYGCSDHASWTKKGFPSAMAFEASFDASNKDIHTERDTLATSGGDASHSVPFAKLAAAFAVELAKAAPNPSTTASASR
ncbi:MAG: M28 family metallopeptidase [Elusimicrobiota bacterium]|nr:MAG: M28 family metallopeptidase [Elusimicrobiota bacterium]